MEYRIHVKSRIEREAIIAKAKKATQFTERFDDFRNEPIDLDVVTLEIGLPVYRMANCRTFSEQQNTIAKEGLDPSYFSKGQESTEAQKKQHDILKKITKSASASVADMFEVLEKEGQRENLLITSTGVVVNGNRRLSVMRELSMNEPKKFSHVKCDVLPSDASADDIDDVEAALQARPQTKLDYDWVGEAQLVRRQIEKGRSAKQVADQLRRKESEIKNLLQALTEAELYLSEWVSKPSQYTLVAKEGEQLFKDIPKHIEPHDTQMKNACRAIAWSIFDNPNKFPGRIYNYNEIFGKLAPQVIQSVTTELDMELSENVNEDNGEFYIALEEDNQTLDYGPFINALHKKEERTIDALANACTTVIEREKGKNRQDAALKSLMQIQSKLTAIDISTAGQNTYQPMLARIKAIGDILKKLEENVSRILT